MARGDEQMNVRVPNGLREELKLAAKANQRTMNGEVVARLSQPDGMTLRDWFAGQAMATLLAATTLNPMHPHVAAGRSYEYADALLAARTTPSTEEGQ